MTRELTRAERRAVTALQRLEQIWPATIMLFSCDGVLLVVDTAQYRAGITVTDIFARIRKIANDAGTDLNPL